MCDLDVALCRDFTLEQPGFSPILKASCKGTALWGAFFVDTSMSTTINMSQAARLLGISKQRAHQLGPVKVSNRLTAIGDYRVRSRKGKRRVQVQLSGTMVDLQEAMQATGLGYDRVRDYAKANRDVTKKLKRGRKPKQPVNSAPEATT